MDDLIFYVNDFNSHSSQNLDLLNPIKNKFTNLSEESYPYIKCEISHPYIRE